MPLWTFTRPSLTDPKSLQRVRLTATSHVGPGQSPFNLTTRFGEYYVAFIRSGDAMVEYTSWGSPPWQFMGPATSTADVSEPRVACTPQRRTFLVYTRAGPFVGEKVSDDDARSWNPETVTWNPGKHPDITAGLDGSLLRSAWVAGTIQGTWQGPGDAAPSGVFTFTDGASNLAVTDDSFRVVQDRSRWWWLHVRITGDATTSLWASFDEGRTWQRMMNGITGGSHPGLAQAPDGSLLAWAYVSGTLQTIYRAAGNAAFGAAVAVKDAASMNLAVADDAACFAQAYEHARRWLLVVGITGAGAVLDWASADEGSSVEHLG